MNVRHTATKYYKKFLQIFSDRAINIAVIAVFSIAGFIVGNINKAYSTITVLPERVQALEINQVELVDSIKGISSDISDIEKNLSEQKMTNVYVNGKLDSIDAKLDHLTLKLIK